MVMPGKPLFARTIFILLMVSLWVVGAYAEDVTVSDGTFQVTLGPGQTRGYAVVVGDPEGRFARELAEKTELTVCLQIEDAKVRSLRAALEKDGLLNKRIYVEALGAGSIPLADNLADMVFVLTGRENISREEILRVLHPGPGAYLGKEMLIKPWPAGMDDWSHPYHGPDNNPRSTDEKALWPYITQYFAEPHFAPMPQVTLISGGRLFNFYGHIAFHEREEEWLNALLAVSGWNGAILWKRKLSPDFQIHRNNKVATPDTLYYTEKSVLRVIDTVTGKEVETVAAPREASQAGDTDWKWLGLEDAMLIAVLGAVDQPTVTSKHRIAVGGWPWKNVSKGYNDKDVFWGYGRTVVALDPKTHEVKWTYREKDGIDTRATCLSNGRMYLFKFGAYLTALNTKTGKVTWKKTVESHSDFFEKFGKDLKRQGAQTGLKTNIYLKCDEKALYFAGAPFKKLIVVSAKDGEMLWEYPYEDYRLILGPDGLYGLGKKWLFGSGDKQSKRFNPVTGKVLQSYDTFDRHSCVTPTANADSLFMRAWPQGTSRLNLKTGVFEKMFISRPTCMSGVLTGNGHTYWLPYVCDCRATMYGFMCNASAGNADFSGKVTDKNLEPTPDVPAKLVAEPLDWPQLRRDAGRSSTSQVTLVAKPGTVWTYQGPSDTALTAPIAVGDWVYVGGSDGVLRAIDNRGKLAWQAPTGGEIKAAPTFWKGAVLIGSGDGHAYSFNAETGKLLWRFRAAPARRMIPVYGKLLSTWPVATGVVVDEKGMAYFAAGILNQNQVHVYALDAVSAKLKWENHTSGSIDENMKGGISVMGPMLIDPRHLHMPAGATTGLGVYDLKTGQCLSTYRADRTAAGVTRDSRGASFERHGRNGC